MTDSSTVPLHDDSRYTASDMDQLEASDGDHEHIGVGFVERRSSDLLNLTSHIDDEQQALNGRNTKPRCCPCQLEFFKPLDQGKNRYLAIITIASLIFFVVLFSIVVAFLNTSAPKPSVIVLISIDGFAWNYITNNKILKPNLDRFRSKGVSWQLHPQFPSKTFPNHYSIITGMYTQNHGIVGNEFYDPIIKRQFSISNTTEVAEPRWWLGQPFWNVVLQNDLKAASYFWPGSDTFINGMRPTYSYPYNEATPNEVRIEQILRWLDMSSPDRPSFITSYFSDVDSAGHLYGPNAPETADAIYRLDKVLGKLFDGIQARHSILDIHTMVVSDHGMASIVGGVFLDDFLSTDVLSQLYIPDLNSPMTNIWFRQNQETLLPQVYSSLKQLNNSKVYLKSEIPSHLFFNTSNRIAPLVVIGDLGWIITTKVELAQRPWVLSGGSHGWDPKYNAMTSIFLAQGHKFPPNNEIKSLQNTEIFNLMASILGIKPTPNNGTLPNHE